MSRAPSLSDQGRALSALRQRIVEIHERAEARGIEDPKHADAYRAQAEAEAAPLVAEGAALRDAIVARARRRATLAWRVVYVAAALIVLVVGWAALRGSAS